MGDDSTPPYLTEFLFPHSCTLLLCCAKIILVYYIVGAYIKCNCLLLNYLIQIGPWIFKVWFMIYLLSKAVTYTIRCFQIYLLFQHRHGNISIIHYNYSVQRFIPGWPFFLANCFLIDQPFSLCQLFPWADHFPMSDHFLLANHFSMPTISLGRQFP